MRALLQLIVLLAFSATCLAMDFTPPKPEDRLSAIGRTDGLQTALQRALNPGNDFEPLPIPRPGDWLAEHPEPGQTFDQFIISKPTQPDATRNKLYLQPLGEFLEGLGPPLEALSNYAAAFFAMDVLVRPALNTDGPGIRIRLNPHTSQRQFLTTDILDLLGERVPRF